MLNVFKMLFVCAAFVSFGLVYADAEPSNITQFDQLVEIYETEGELPTFEELEGWRAGRCYRANEPSRAWGGLLVAEERDVEGPLFNKLRKLFILRSETADLYENMKPVKKKLVSHQIDSLWDLVNPIEEVESSLSCPSSYGRHENRLRKYDDYLVASVVLLMDDFGLKKGDTLWACYFFKKVSSSK